MDEPTGFYAVELKLSMGVGNVWGDRRVLFHEGVLVREGQNAQLIYEVPPACDSPDPATATQPNKASPFACPPAGHRIQATLGFVPPGPTSAPDARGQFRLGLLEQTGPTATPMTRVASGRMSAGQATVELPAVGGLPAYHVEITFRPALGRGP